MSQWSYVDGHFIPTTTLVSVTTTTPTTTTAASSSTTTSYNHTDLDAHYFAQIASVDVSGGVVLEKATGNSEHVVGVVTQLDNNKVAVAHSGVVYAWVCRGPVTPPLSGIYEKTINGVFAGNVVIDVHPDNSFTMCQTHDDELSRLRQRFDALTTTT